MPPFSGSFSKPCTANNTTWIVKLLTAKIYGVTGKSYQLAALKNLSSMVFARV
jgi:hypothetical protein